MGQRLRVSVKRQRRKAYLDRKKQAAKAAASRAESSRAKRTKKTAEAPQT